jgi:alkylation response protein AidB-like acyl-CoA dehydrogenase
VDFSQTEEQQMLQESVQQFVRKSYDFDTRNSIVSTEEGYSAEFWKLFAELGWLTVPFSEADGGFGDSAVDLTVMMDEFGKALLVEPYLATVVLGGGLIAALADEKIKREFLPQIMSGALQLSLASAEHGGRYNPLSVATTAQADGDKIILDGVKTAVLNGINASYVLVTARESGEVSAEDGISVFLVPTKSPGVSIHGFTTIDGRSSSEVKLEAVSVDASARLGLSGKAAEALVLVNEKATLACAAEALGALESMLHKTVEYSKTRKQFGTSIGTFQALQHRMADMFIQCQLARSIVIRAAMKIDSSESTVEKAKAVSAAKSRIGYAIKAVGQEAIQIHGGIAMTEELDVGHLFRRVTALDIMFGDADYHTERYASLL